MQTCDFPKCKNISYIGYIGYSICSKHWDDLCGSDIKKENRLLKKIFLKRTPEGEVVPIIEK